MSCLPSHLSPSALCCSIFSHPPVIKAVIMSNRVKIPIRPVLLLNKVYHLQEETSDNLDNLSGIPLCIPMTSFLTSISCRPTNPHLPGEGFCYLSYLVLGSSVYRLNRPFALCCRLFLLSALLAKSVDCGPYKPF